MMMMMMMMMVVVVVVVVVMIMIMIMMMIVVVAVLVLVLVERRRVSCLFRPSQPERITSGLKTNFNLPPIYSAHKSPNHKFSAIH